MKIAQILYDKVHWIPNTTDTLEEYKKRFAPSVVLVEVADDAEEGWLWDGTQAVKSPGATLDELKAAKWQSIKAIRDALEREPLPYMGKLLDFDQTSSERLNWAISTAQIAVMTSQPFVVNWTCHDSSILTLTAQDILGIPLAVAMRSDGLHQISRGLVAQIGAATTAEELDLIVWPE